MDSLPIELLRKIFVVGCDSELIETGLRPLHISRGPSTGPALKPFIVSVSRVCHLWNSLVIEDQYFWVTWKYLETSYHNDSVTLKTLEEARRLCLEAPRDCQVDFHFKHTGSHSNDPRVTHLLPVLSELLESRRRQFQCLRLEVDADSDFLQHLGRAHWDNLQVLWLGIYPIKDDVEPDLPLEVLAPRLHTLTFDDRRLGPHSHFPRVKGLFRMSLWRENFGSSKEPFDWFIAMVRPSMESLTSLAVRVEITKPWAWEEWPAGGVDLQLPCLRELSISSVDSFEFVFDFLSLIKTSCLSKHSIAAVSYIHRPDYPPSYLSSESGYTWRRLRSVTTLKLRFQHVIIYDWFFALLQNTDRISDLTMVACSCGRKECHLPGEVIQPQRTVQFRNLVNFRYYQLNIHKGSLAQFCNQFDFSPASGFVLIHPTLTDREQVPRVDFDFPKAQTLRVPRWSFLQFIAAPTISELHLPIDQLFSSRLEGFRTNLPTVTKLCLHECSSISNEAFVSLRELQRVMPNISSIELPDLVVSTKGEDGDIIRSLPISLSGIEPSQAPAFRIVSLSVIFSDASGSSKTKELLQAIRAHVEERQSLGLPRVQTLRFNRTPPQCDELEWLKREVMNLEIRKQESLGPGFTRWAGRGY